MSGQKDISIAVIGGSIAASAALNTFWLAAFLVPAWLLLLFAWSYVTSVASHVYRGALYLYAAEGYVAAPYDQDMLNMAWKYRK